MAKEPSVRFILRNSFYFLLGKEENPLCSQIAHPHEIALLKEFLPTVVKCKQCCVDDFRNTSEILLATIQKDDYGELLTTLTNDLFRFKTHWSGVIFFLHHVAEWLLKYSIAGQASDSKIDSIYDALEERLSNPLQFCIECTGGWRKSIEHLRLGKVNNIDDSHWPRTKVSIQNAFSFFVAEIDPIPPVHFLEWILVESFIEAAQDFKCFRPQGLFEGTGKAIPVPQRLPPKHLLETVARTVFGGKITFNRILLYIMYVAEWTLKYAPERSYFVCRVLDDIVSDKLQILIDSRGGWLKGVRSIVNGFSTWRSEDERDPALSRYSEEKMELLCSINFLDGNVRKEGGWKETMEERRYYPCYCDAERRYGTPEERDFSYIIRIFGGSKLNGFRWDNRTHFNVS